MLYAPCKPYIMYFLHYIHNAYREMSGISGNEYFRNYAGE